MSDLNMNIVIGATVSDALRGLESLSAEIRDLATGGVASIDKLKTAMDQLKDAAAKTTDVGQLAKYNQAIEKLSGEATRLKSVGLGDEFKKMGAGSNTAAFALQNLGRVAQDAPFGFIAIQNNLNPLLESFQRLKAESGSTSIALKALAGSFLGPAGIGVALSLVSSAILLFTSRSKGAKDAVEDTAKAVKTLDQVLEDSTVSVQGQIAKVNALVAAFGDRTSSINTQRAALAELTKLDKEHFGALNAETSSYQDVKVAADAYTDSLVRQAIIKGITDDITDLSKNLRLAQKAYVEAATAADKANRSLTLQLQVPNISSTGIGSIAGASQIFSSLSSKSNDARDKVLELRKAMVQLNDELQRQINEGLKLFNAPTPTPDPDKTKKSADALKQVSEAFKTIRDNQLAVIDNNQKIENFVGDISRAKPTNFGLVDKGSIELLERMAFNAFLVRDAFDSIFQSIESGKNVFDSLGQSLTSLLKKLIATAIEAAILTAILSLLPGGGGFAAVTIKGIISEFKGLMGFAGGGIVTRPTLAMVGEQGPERITPLNQISNSGGGSFPSEIVLRAQGSELRTVLKRDSSNNYYVN